MSGPPDNSPTARREWVVRYLANLLGMDAADVDLTKGLGEYGLDSVDAMIMAGHLEEHFQIEIDPAVFFEYDTLQQMLDAWNAAAGTP